MKDLRKTRLCLSLVSYRSNVRLMKSIIGPSVKLMAVVKADAYGHGMIPFAKAAVAAGADQLGVAIAEEGLLLREAGLVCPILVFGALNREGMAAAAEQGLTVPVFTVEGTRLAQEAAAIAGRMLDVHIKMDTGMGRIGLRTRQELEDVLREIKRSPQLRLCGAFMHFADAENEDQRFSDLQLARFHELLTLLPDGLLIHAAASAAMFRQPGARFGMVRAGIALFGYPPGGGQRGFKPCLSFLAEVTQVKEVEAGTHISYGCTYCAARKTRVATLAAGYGDGYPRALSNKGRVLIGGRSCPIIGRVCMDQFMVDVTEVPQVQAGDEAVLIGSQGDAFIGADELARLVDSISYDILLSPSARVPRVFLDEEEDGNAE
ncbi:MAG: alanine racemase [Christensenellales bacterium]